MMGLQCADDIIWIAENSQHIAEEKNKQILKLLTNKYLINSGAEEYTSTEEETTDGRSVNIREPCWIEDRHDDTEDLC